MSGEQQPKRRERIRAGPQTSQQRPRTVLLPLFLLSVIKSLQGSWASAGDHIFQPRGQQDMALRQNLANGRRMDMASAALRAQGGPCSSLSAFRTGGAMAWCWGTTWSMQTRGRPGQSFRRWGPWACGDLSITWKLVEMQIGAPPPDLPN